MLKLVMMITIIERDQSEEVMSFFNNNNIPMTLGRYGRGTATDVILNYLGIAEKEKCITFSVTQIEMATEVINKLKSKVRNIFAFAVPISSVGGKNTMEHFEEIVSSNGENKETNKSYKFKDELILIITNRGYVDTVMDIARKSGAPGGTVIHARGTRNR